MREREKEKYEREEKRDEEARKGTEGRRKREEAHIPPTRGGSQRGGPGPGPPPLPKEKKTYRSKVAIRLSTNIDQRPCSTFLSLSLSLSLLPFPPPPSTVIPRSFTASNQFSPKRLGSPRSRLNPLAQKPPLSFSLSFSPPSIERRFGGRDGRKTDGRVLCTRHR